MLLCLPQGVEPVLRTYNTLIIACNMCNQPREARAVHRRMLHEGYTPNATTYNALISAYGKAGQLDKVMEVSNPLLLVHSNSDHNTNQPAVQLIVGQVPTMCNIISCLGL